MCAKTHPHIDKGTEEQIAAVLTGKEPELRDVYLAVHRLILTTLPDVMYSTDCTDGETGYGMRQYGYDGWGMAVLGAYSRWVSFTFLHGADLADPAGLLEGTKRMRHVKLRSMEQFEQCRSELQRLIESAAALHAD